ncbi:LamB/YcsF family protein [Abyssogena phaseoliformis symbiont OG214]|uniref:5-oxoprolinase subunit PxpA n=1 Tax=Abyssogena phaseoliformis symbiont TaxID=596095 RepID=UPI0019155988|nr:5-oxoprolinase subunit PxpA [Abyssogena phaseoliformis symbiont]MBW5289256.1 Lactam utilization protein LamB [Candidatus Ruthia sp. Apha_13_S6]BBB22717.1 LamB/YcsF family protein [Abyssogena phaseoliformis symbiont OG214]
MQHLASKKLINCDLGECLTPNPDTHIMPLIDMANIACGGHAGNDKSMVQTIQLAMQNSVTIGVHPSYLDKENFGRLSYDLNKNELFDLIYNQVLHFQHLCTEHGAQLNYIKPHGALYHDMTHKQFVLHTMCDVIKAINQNLSLVVQAGNENHFKHIETNTKIQLLHEVFADRGYHSTHIIPRGEKGAVLDNAHAIVKQYQDFLFKKSFKIDIICFHSDNIASIEALKILKNA